MEVKPFSVLALMEGRLVGRCSGMALADLVWVEEENLGVLDT